MKNSNLQSGIATSSELVRNEKGSALPYIFGWLLGVPVSLLILIALVRAVF